MKAVKDSTGLYEVERRARHAEPPSFRTQELPIGSKQRVPLHSHTRV